MPTCVHVSEYALARMDRYWDDWVDALDLHVRAPAAGEVHCGECGGNGWVTNGGDGEDCAPVECDECGGTGCVAAESEAA